MGIILLYVVAGRHHTIIVKTNGWLLFLMANGGPFRVSKIAIKTVRLPFIPTLLYCIY